MTPKANKVKFGFKNVHYAVITDTGTGITYGTPKRLPGAVSGSLTANGEIVEFAADDITYWSAEINNGYDGEIVIADVPQDFLTEILGEEVVNGISYEKATQKGKKFALLFEIDGDEHKRRAVYYYCTATRPTEEASTKEGTSVTPQTSTITLQSRPHPYNEYIKARTTELVSAETFNNWFTTVHEKGAVVDPD